MKGYNGVAAALLLSLICSVQGTDRPLPRYITCPDPDPVDHTVFFPHENDCTQFYRCDHGSALLESCPSGLHWNPVQDVCDWPWNAGCSPSSGGGGNGCGGGGEGGGGGNGDGCPAGDAPACPADDPANPVFFPHPNDCHWFYQCSGGVAYCMVCPSGLHWNENKDVCDWPWEAGCTGNGGGGEGGGEGGEGGGGEGGEGGGGEGGEGGGGGGGNPPVTGSCPVPQPSENIYFPDPNDCTIFYQCSYGVAFQQKCPAGLHFNPTLNVCDYPENAGCSVPGSGATSAPGSGATSAPGSGATSSPGSGTTSAPGSGAAPCPAATPPACPADDPALSVFFPHPTDTHWFYHCSNGIPYCKICPSGLNWHQEIQLCGW